MEPVEICSIHINFRKMLLELHFTSTINSVDISSLSQYLGKLFYTHHLGSVRISQCSPYQNILASLSNELSALIDGIRCSVDFVEGKDIELSRSGYISEDLILRFLIESYLVFWRAKQAKSIREL